MFSTVSLIESGRVSEFDATSIGIDVIQLLVRLRHEEGVIMFDWSDGVALVIAQNDCMEFHVEIHGDTIWIMDAVDAEELCQMVLDGADIPTVREFRESRGVDP